MRCIFIPFPSQARHWSKGWRNSTAQNSPALLVPAGETGNNGDRVISSDDKGEEGETPSPGVMASGEGAGPSSGRSKAPSEQGQEGCEQEPQGSVGGEFQVDPGFTAHKCLRPEQS